MSLKKALVKLANAIESKVEAPNNGGCGVIASCVARKLEKLGVKADVVVIRDRYCPGKDIPEVRVQLRPNPTVREWNQAGVRVHHLMLRITLPDGEEVFWDSNGVRGEAAGPTMKHPFTIAELHAMARERDGWNNWFDRSQIPTIKQLVDDTLVSV